MKNIREIKGITLIALTVTIIILIILSGISINLILGQNGIINKAKQGKENIELAQTEEEEILNDVYEEIEKKEQNQTVEVIDKIKPQIINLTSGTTSITFSATDDLSGIVGYQLTTTDEEPAEFNTLEKTTVLNDQVVSNLTSGVLYYLWVKDEKGNISESKSIETHAHTTECYTYTYHKHTGNTTSGGGCYTSKRTTICTGTVSFLRDDEYGEPFYKCNTCGCVAYESYFDYPSCGVSTTRYSLNCGKTTETVETETLICTIQN